MSADGVFFLANVIGVIALGIGVMCAAAITISGKIRDGALKVQLEESRSANLKLEAQIAPRRINPDQQEAIARALESFAGKSVNFDSYILDVEAAGLGEQISGVLVKAKIKSDPTGLRKRIPGGSITEGVKISGKDDKLVAGLLASLEPTGIKATRGEAEPSSGGDRVSIIVGGSIPMQGGDPNAGSLAGRMGRPVLPGSAASPWDATIFVGVKPLAP
jgi:hypothetical protein